MNKGQMRGTDALPASSLITAAQILGLIAAPCGAQSPYVRQGDVRVPMAEAVMKERKVWGTDISFGGNATRGNSRTGLINAGAAFFRSWNQSTLTLTGSALHQTASGRQLQNQGKATLRYDYKLVGPWGLFAYNTHGYNDLLRLDYRVKIGAGPWRDMLLGKARLGSGLAFAQVYERFQGGSIERTARLLLRNNVRVPISKVADLKAELFYVPAVKDFNDYHLDGEISLQTVFWKEYLALRLGWLGEYDSRPKPRVVSTDTYWTASLVFQMGR